MSSPTLELAFDLPDVRPLDKPMAFTGHQVQRMISAGNQSSRPALLQKVAQRVEMLRGPSITWAFGLSFDDLVTWSVRTATGAAAGLPAPLTLFKIEHFQWIPKVVIRVCCDSEIDIRELGDYCTVSRRASIEFLTVTPRHISQDYLSSHHFKRAFNGAFFCDAARNSTIFCPTLREMGCYSWDQMPKCLRRR